MEQYVLKAPKGANKKKKIVGRGSGTRLQKTAGKGNKGQNARAGGGVRPGFEGGQMPLYRRIARRGFSNYPFKKEAVPVNLETIEKNFQDGEAVTLDSLKEKGIIKNRTFSVKVLGKGELTKKLSFEGLPLSASAKEKILKCGGSIKEPVTESTEE
ncbi:MAG: 50S ribosomal protein L15 [Spirochaetales bacterium]